MKRIAVFIATTGGPVRVERITRERAPQSMVCLKRTSTVLPISAGYDSFVRPGSGVIERVLGPFEDGAFRLDVSAPIDTGTSWQLGAFLAHAIAARPTQASLSTDDEADTVVWATGSVDHDLAVGAVGHMAEKLYASAKEMQRWHAAGKTVIMFMGADPGDGPVTAAHPANVRLAPIAAAQEALVMLGLTAETLPAIPAPLPARRPKPAIAWKIAAGVSIAAVAGLLAAERFMPAPQTEAASVTPAAPPVAAASPRSVKLAIVERRAPAGHTCAEVQFGRVAPEETPVDTADSSRSASDSLCGLGLVVDNGTQAQFVAVMLDVVSGKLLLGSERPETLDGRTSFVGRQEWPLDLPRRMQQPFEIQATAISAAHPTDDIARTFKTAAADTTPDLGVAAVHHRVMP
jgi:hypothetical protein